MKTKLALVAALFSLALTAPSLAQSPTQQATRTVTNRAQADLTFGSAPPTGSLVVVCCDGATTSAATISGAGVTNWRPGQATTAASVPQRIWCGIVDATPSRSLTVRFGATLGGAAVWAGEWRGRTGDLVVSGASRQGPSDGSRTATTGTLQVAADDIVIASLVTDYSSLTTPSSTGFSLLQRLTPSRGNPLVVYGRSSSSAGSASANWNLRRTMHWSSLIVACHFEPPAPSPSLQLVQQKVVTRSDVEVLEARLDAVPTPGDVLVLCHESTSSGAATVSGGGVAQWTRCGVSAPGLPNASIWAGVVGGVPSDTIAIALGGGEADGAVVVSQWRGVAVPIAFEVAIADDAVGSASARTEDLLARRGDLAIAMVGLHVGGIGISAPSDGFAELGQAASSSLALAAASRLPLADGPVGTQWALQSSARWVAPIVVFRGASGAPEPQAVERVQMVANAAWNVSGLRLQLDRAPVPGDLIVVCHESNSSSNSTISGGGVAQWTRCIGSAPDIVNSSIWAGVVGNAPSAVIDIALGSSPNGACAIATVWRGLGPTLAYRSALASAPNGSTQVATPAIEAVAGDLVMAMVGLHQGGNTISGPDNAFIDLGKLYLASTGMAAGSFVPLAPGNFLTHWVLQYSTRWAAPIVVFEGL